MSKRKDPFDDVLETAHWENFLDVVSRQRRIDALWLNQFLHKKRSTHCSLFSKTTNDNLLKSNLLLLLEQKSVSLSFVQKLPKLSEFQISLLNNVNVFNALRKRQYKIWRGLSNNVFAHIEDVLLVQSLPIASEPSSEILDEESSESSEPVSPEASALISHWDHLEKSRQRIQLGLWFIFGTALVATGVYLSQTAVRERDNRLIEYILSGMLGLLLILVHPVTKLAPHFIRRFQLYNLALDVKVCDEQNQTFNKFEYFYEGFEKSGALLDGKVMTEHFKVLVEDNMLPTHPELLLKVLQKLSAVQFDNLSQPIVMRALTHPNHQLGLHTIMSLDSPLNDHQLIAMANPYFNLCLNRPFPFPNFRGQDLIRLTSNQNLSVLIALMRQYAMAKMLLIYAFSGASWLGFWLTIINNPMSLMNKYRPPMSDATGIYATPLVALLVLSMLKWMLCIVGWLYALKLKLRPHLQNKHPYFKEGLICVNRGEHAPQCLQLAPEDDLLPTLFLPSKLSAKRQLLLSEMDLASQGLTGASEADKNRRFSV